MTDQPSLSVNQRIKIRVYQGRETLPACVVTVYPPEVDEPKQGSDYKADNTADGEVVYKDGTRFGASKVVWNGEYWTLTGPDSEYGDFSEVAHNPLFASAIHQLEHPAYSQSNFKP
jgi:hypothetical protein